MNNVNFLNEALHGLARWCAAVPPFLIIGFLSGGTSACAAGDRDALRKIVQEQCLVHWSQQQSPLPCESVGAGFAVLADRKGGAHFLLIPTRTITGVESPEVLEPGAPNYFDAAWAARDRLSAAAGRSVPRSAVGLALNPKHARSQDQLHIHIECLRAAVADSLRESSGQLTGAWSPVSIAGWRFDALRVMGEDLGASNPFRLLADLSARTRTQLQDYSLVVAGMQFKDGPGFAVVAGTGLAGELLLDSSCAVADGAEK
jgi:CDP-diacylglycerol pyrophosphatase